jgi:GT2 family glycosyltransferase
MYSEEVDLQYRLRKKGWKAYYIPQAHAIHHGGASQGRARRRRAVYRGKLLFYRKNRRRSKYLALRFALAVIAAAKFMAWTTRAVLPWRRDSAMAEAKSNLEILKLCAEIA